MSFIKENKVKIMKIIILIISIPYVYIIMNAIFELGRIVGSIARINMG